jgi:type II secretory pathway pseudopilin PulG
MMRLLNRSNKQAGISLLEVMLSLSIIAIILVMATRYFFVANNNSNVNKLRGEIATIVSALQNYRNQHPNYSAVGMGVLITDGFIDKTADVDESAGLYNNPWTSPINVMPSGTNGSSATITTDVPSAADCNAVASGYSTQQSPDGTAAGFCGTGAGSTVTFTVVVGSP